MYLTSLYDSLQDFAISACISKHCFLHGFYWLLCLPADRPLPLPPCLPFICLMIWIVNKQRTLTAICLHLVRHIKPSDAVIEHSLHPQCSKRHQRWLFFFFALHFPLKVHLSKVIEKLEECSVSCGLVWNTLVGKGWWAAQIPSLRPLWWEERDSLEVRGQEMENWIYPLSWIRQLKPLSCGFMSQTGTVWLQLTNREVKDVFPQPDSSCKPIINIWMWQVCE